MELVNYIFLSKYPLTLAKLKGIKIDGCYKPVSQPSAYVGIAFQREDLSLQALDRPWPSLPSYLILGKVVKTEGHLINPPTSWSQTTTSQAEDP